MAIWTAPTLYALSSDVCRLSTPSLSPEEKRCNTQLSEICSDIQRAFSEKYPPLAIPEEFRLNCLGAKHWGDIWVSVVLLQRGHNGSARDIKTAKEAFKLVADRFYGVIPLQEEMAELDALRRYYLNKSLVLSPEQDRLAVRAAGMYLTVLRGRIEEIRQGRATEKDWANWYGLNELMEGTFVTPGSSLPDKPELISGFREVAAWFDLYEFIKYVKSTKGESSEKYIVAGQPTLAGQKIIEDAWQGRQRLMAEAMRRAAEGLGRDADAQTVRYREISGQMLKRAERMAALLKGEPGLPDDLLHQGAISDGIRGRSGSSAAMTMLPPAKRLSVSNVPAPVKDPRDLTLLPPDIPPYLARLNPGYVEFLLHWSQTEEGQIQTIGRMVQDPFAARQRAAQVGYVNWLMNQCGRSGQRCNAADINKKAYELAFGQKDPVTGEDSFVLKSEIAAAMGLESLRRQGIILEVAKSLAGYDCYKLIRDRNQASVDEKSGNFGTCVLTVAPFFGWAAKATKGLSAVVGLGDKASEVAELAASGGKEAQIGKLLNESIPLDTQGESAGNAVLAGGQAGHPKSEWKFLPPDPNWEETALGGWLKRVKTNRRTALEDIRQKTGVRIVELGNVHDDSHLAMLLDNIEKNPPEVKNIVWGHGTGSGANWRALGTGEKIHDVVERSFKPGDNVLVISCKTGGPVNLCETSTAYRMQIGGKDGQRILWEDLPPSRIHWEDLSSPTAGPDGTGAFGTLVPTVGKNLKVQILNEGRPSLHQFDANLVPEKLPNVHAAAKGKVIETEDGRKLLVWDKNEKAIQLRDLRSGQTEWHPLKEPKLPAHFYSISVAGKTGPRQIKLIMPALKNSEPDLLALKNLKNSLSRMPDDVLVGVEQITVHPFPYWDEPAVHSSIEYGVRASWLPGRIDFYPSANLGLSERAMKHLSHELGHNLAKAKFDSTNPGKLWEDAMQADAKAIPGYAKPNEDFAEAVSMYLMSDGGIKNPQLLKQYAHRFKVIDALLGITPQARQNIFIRMRAWLAAQNIFFWRGATGVTVLVGNSMFSIDNKQ